MYALIWNLVKTLWAIVFLAIAIKVIVANYDTIEKIPTIIKNKLTSISIQTEIRAETIVEKKSKKTK